MSDVFESIVMIDESCLQLRSSAIFILCDNLLGVAHRCLIFEVVFGIIVLDQSSDEVSITAKCDLLYENPAAPRASCK